MTADSQAVAAPGVAPAKIVFWSSSACRSVLPLFDEVATILHTEVVVETSLSESRRRLGWQRDEAESVAVRCLPRTGWRQETERLLAANRGALHVFGGYLRFPKLRHAILRAQQLGLSVGVMTEAPLNMFDGPRRWLKEVYLRRVVPARTRPIARRSSFVLCLSGRRFGALAAAGWPQRKIFPFGYFPRQRGVTAAGSPDSAELRLLCLGFLSRHKGVDLLLRGLGLLRERGLTFRCDVTGEGEERRRLEALGDRLGLRESVRFRGVVSDAEIDGLLASGDVLVAPGYREPWGVRVNEALQAGLPVVASDRLGAADLVTASGAGRVFRSGDVGELCDCLAELASDRALLARLRRRAVGYRGRIAPRVAAGHAVAIFRFALSGEGQRPVPPWYAVAGDVQE